MQFPRMIGTRARLLLTTLGASVLCSHLIATDTTATEVANQSRPSSPVSPRESLQWLETEPGFQVELVAAEPQIIDPVSMRMDGQGRIWVVEMGDYPTQDDAPKSRIVILQDKDNDGFFESSTVFADNLLFATGVQPWQNGAIVTAQGQLLMLRDTDGDLRSDSTEVWLEGFSTGNPQLRANHPIIFSDGWLYIASGLRGGKINATLPFGSQSSEPLDLTGCDLRVHMLTGRIESIAGPTQFGLSFDQFGHRYGCSNRNPCFEIVSERADLSLSPLSGLASALRDVSPSNAESKVHPLVNAWTTSNLHAGQFTAACGLLVTHSRHFPDAPFATALTCEPTGSLVQRRTIVRKQGLSEVTDEASHREWLASRDPWFRPVDLYEGPGGDIFVVDMYRAVIEHPDWVPAELKNRPDQRLGDSHGRIYRVTRKTLTEKKGYSIDARPLNPSQWIAHPDSWHRNTAAQWVLEAAAKGHKESFVSALREICSSESLPIGSIASACSLLFASDSMDESTVALLMKSSSSELRSMVWSAMRQSSRSWDPKWSIAAIEVFDNPHAAVDEMIAAAWFIGVPSMEGHSQSHSVRMARFAGLATKALFQNGDPPHLWMAATAAWRNDALTFLSSYQAIARKAEKTMSPLARECVVRMASRAAQQPSSVFTLKHYVETIALEIEDMRTPSTQATNFAILEGIARSGKLSIEPDSTVERLIQRSAASDEDPINQRAAIAILASSDSSSSKALALKRLERADPFLLKTAIATCSAHDTSEFATWLLDRFPSALPEIRQDLFNAIRNHPKRLAMMVDQLENGKLSPKVFDASQIQNLAMVRDISIAPRLAKVLSTSINSNRQKVIEEYSNQLSMIQVDQNRNVGKAVFVKNCSVCHKLDGMGAAVGPDISDSRELTFEKLLISILDPNRSIDANYFRFLARTEDGNVTGGLLKDSNSQTITLQSQNGTLTTLNRSEIEELKSSGTSLMPEGIESQISVHEMADLLWYVKNWRYAADQVPANATIKK